MAVKLLITGFENTGKSTLASKIENALIINCDGKSFNFKTPHSDFTGWKGYKDFEKFVISKILAYKNKLNELPRTIVFDTITHLYLDITNFNRRNYSGFDIHSQNNDDAQSLNDFIENKLIREKNINIVLMAHTTIEPKTNRFSVPAQGSFARAGGFVSFVDESIYIDRNEEHLIVLKDPTNAVVRSVLKYDEDKFVVHFNTFDINKHLAALEHISNDSEESKL